MILKRLLRNPELADTGGTAVAEAEVKAVVGEQPKGPDMTVEFSDDLDTMPEPPKVEETPKTKVVEFKVPEKKTTDTTKVEDKVAEAKVTDNKPNMLAKLKEKSTRDYTGFSDDQVKILKSMSNEAFAYVAPLLKAPKQAAAPPTNQQFFQHPQAFVLHPYYQRITSVGQNADAEANAWMEQLVKIESGEEWTPLIGVDQKTGKFIYGDARKPSIQDKEAVRSSMMRCQQVSQGAKAQLQIMPQQFQQQANTDLQLINQERAKRFDWVADPKLLDFEMDLDGIGKKKVGDIRNDFVSLFPAYHRQTPGVEVAADLFVALQVYAQRLKEAESNATVQQTLKEEGKRVEPTSSTRQKAPAKGTHGITEFSLDGLPDY